MNNEDTVVVKFINGDQIIARLLNSTPDGVLLFRPITLKFHQLIHNGILGERITTSLYCPVSSDESFVFDIRHCLYINKLHPNMISHYEKLSEDLYSNLNRTVKLDELEDDQREEQQELSTEKPDNVTLH